MAQSRGEGSDTTREGGVAAFEVGREEVDDEGDRRRLLDDGTVDDCAVMRENLLDET